MPQNSKIIIIGNSGSGKSTLAKGLAAGLGLAHLDLDAVAWDLRAEEPTRAGLAESARQIEEFRAAHPRWVMEGCYADLAEMVLPQADLLIFINIPADECIENARTRPWEPHKYESKEAQDANLDFLISWIKDYDSRDDVLSQKAHLQLFEDYDGEKIMLENRTALNQLLNEMTISE